MSRPGIQRLKKNEDLKALTFTDLHVNFSIPWDSVLVAARHTNLVRAPFERQQSDHEASLDSEASYVAANHIPAVFKASWPQKSV